MENDSKKINCPICGSSSNKFFCYKNSFNLHRCLVCGHIFIFPFSFDLASFYGEDYFAGAEKGSGYVDYDKDKEPMRSVFIQCLEKIWNFTNKKGKLLDVGAATGFFVEIANKSGWEGQGLEISEYATLIAGGKGLKVDCGTLQTVPFEKESFDCITMWDVLEHLPSPRDDMGKVYTLLKPGGIIAINTPDSGSWFARLLGKRWHLLVPPEHINYFTNTSLGLLLEQNGFKVLEAGKIGKSFTLEYVSSTLSSWLKIGVLQKLVNFLKIHPKIGGFSIPINLRDNMFVIAKKVT